jgi:pyridoxamine 5'-phosphate oxidase
VRHLPGAAPAAGFDEHDLAPTPMEQFARWFAAAREAGEPEPEAMAVSTVGPDGVPACRFVLMKAADERGLVFYTNYRSAKGRHLHARPVAAATFRWYGLGRQVRAGGAVEVVSAEESDAYFATRPRGAQLGAWASRQSEVLADRRTLEQRVADASDRFAGADVPRPPWWGGFRLVPDRMEFWQNRSDRLHDRLRYRAEGGGWRVERLSP